MPVGTGPLVTPVAGACFGMSSRILQVLGALEPYVAVSARRPARNELLSQVAKLTMPSPLPRINSEGKHKRHPETEITAQW